jgi:hypothetical protein
MSRAEAGRTSKAPRYPGRICLPLAFSARTFKVRTSKTPTSKGRPTTLKRSGPTASFPSPTTDFSRRTTEDCCWVEFSRRVGQHPTLLVLSPLN